MNESQTNESYLRILYVCPIIGIAVLPNALPPNKMLDRTFLMPAEDDGTRYRAKIIALVDNHLAENDFKKQPKHIKFKCLVNDKHKEIVAYNNIVDDNEANDTWDGVWKLWRILDYKCVTRSNKNYMQCSVNVLIEWESGETSWQLLHHKDKAGIYDSDGLTLLLLLFMLAKMTSLMPKVGSSVTWAQEACKDTEAYPSPCQAG